MIPKKIIFVGLLIIGAIAFFLKDRSLIEFQSETVQREMKGRDKSRTSEDPEKEKEEKMKEDAKNRGYRFLVGQCVTNRKDGWEYTKILYVGDHVYRIIDCHKYKGCTEQKDISWSDIEVEYRQGRVIPCSR